MDQKQPASSPQAASPRQTLSYLRELFRQHGIQPKNKLGQCFLIDLNILDLLVRAAELSPGDIAVEVGSGIGTYSPLLAERFAEVVGEATRAP